MKKTDNNNQDLVNSYGYEGLTEEQCRAVELLENGGKTKTEVAEILGVHRNTIGAWDKNDCFRAARRKCASEKTRQTLSFIKSHSQEAARELWKMAQSANDKRVAKEIYMYFVDRDLGKIASKVEIDDTRVESDDYDIDEALQRIRQRIKEEKKNKEVE